MPAISLHNTSFTISFRSSYRHYTYLHMRYCNFFGNYCTVLVYKALPMRNLYYGAFYVECFLTFMWQCGVSTQRKLTQHTSFCCGAVDGSQGTKESLKGLTRFISIQNQCYGFLEEQVTYFNT